MYLYGYFQTDGRAEAITWKNFVPAKRDPGSTKEGSRLAGMNLLTCSRMMYNLLRVYNTAGIPVKRDRFSSRPRDHVITTSEWCY